MPTLACLLLAASALTILMPGSVQPWLTSRSTAFEPRDAASKTWLQEVSPCYPCVATPIVHAA